MLPEIKLAQQAEHHYDFSDEEIRPQVTWSIPSKQVHITNHLLTQTTIIIQPKPPCMLSHTAVTLQCRHLCRVQHVPLPPVIHDGVEEYKVEYILDSQVF